MIIRNRTTNIQASSQGACLCFATYFYKIIGETLA